MKPKRKCLMCQSKYEILRTIKLIGIISAVKLKKQTGFSHSEVFVWLPDLTKKGYINKMKKNRKEVLYSITPKGDELLKTINKLMELENVSKN